MSEMSGTEQASGETPPRTVDLWRMAKPRLEAETGTVAGHDDDCQSWLAVFPAASQPHGVSI